MHLLVLLHLYKLNLNSTDEDNRPKTVHDGSPKNDDNTYSSSEILHVAEGAWMTQGPI